jgi:hypothetical protein
MKAPLSASRIAEMQGPYGPLQVLEIKIQQVWGLQQCHMGRWKTQTGADLAIRSPGIWNRGAGPDFREAVLEIDGELRVGDVEIHLYREDWWRHGHDVDAGYDNVILHVVLFGGGMPREVCTLGGSVPEEWIMGPWMREDVESVSGGEPGLFGELVPELKQWIESAEPADIRERLLVGADRRWQDKESMARCLFESFGRVGALHRMTLYYLGFPCNRKVFYEMAEKHPMEDWRDGALLGLLVDRWGERVRWNSGRPASRARKRLIHYLGLNRLHPGWPERLWCVNPDWICLLRAQVLGSWRSGETRRIRSMAGLPAWRGWLRHVVLGESLGSGLSDRLWMDVFLPLLVVGGKIDRGDALCLWFHWYPAHYPSAYNDLMRIAGIRDATGYTMCNGWIQGLLWAEDQLRLERVRSSTGSASASRSRLGA